MTASYEEVKDLINHSEIMLIDVREPNELEETGKIPTSINIPLAQVQQTLSLDFDSQKFENLYGRSKPSLDTNIIFHCKAGGRAQRALDSAKAIGYKNLKNYSGSWLDWAAKEIQ